MKNVKVIFINLVCLLFFVVFAVAVFIGVSLIAPDKPRFFESTGIQKIEKGEL